MMELELTRNEAQVISNLRAASLTTNEQYQLLDLKHCTTVFGTDIKLTLPGVIARIAGCDAGLENDVSYKDNFQYCCVKSGLYTIAACFCIRDHVNSDVIKHCKFTDAEVDMERTCDSLGETKTRPLFVAPLISCTGKETDLAALNEAVRGMDSCPKGYRDKLLCCKKLEDAVNCVCTEDARARVKVQEISSELSECGITDEQIGRSCNNFFLIHD